MPPTFTLGLLLSRREALISASALAASFTFTPGTAHAVDILLANAAISEPAPLGQIAHDQFDRVFGANV
jgi:hypothetical protein